MFCCWKVGVGANRYQYNGKENIEDVGLIDYGWRWYDPAVARWTSVDPLADSYAPFSPYNYVMGNPIRFIDPDGMQVDDIIRIDQSTGVVDVQKMEGDDVVQLVADDGAVLDSYTYGENGSFSEDNSITNDNSAGPNGSTNITFSDSENAETFFKFAAQADVEFGKIDAEKGSSSTSIVTTTHENSTVDITPIVKRLSKDGYTGIRQDHSHPGNVDYDPRAPSGHTGIYPGRDTKQVYNQEDWLMLQMLF